MDRHSAGNRTWDTAELGVLTVYIAAVLVPTTSEPKILPTDPRPPGGGTADAAADGGAGHGGGGSVGSAPDRPAAAGASARAVADRVTEGGDRTALVLLAGWLLLTAAPVAAVVRVAGGPFGAARHALLLAATFAALAAAARWAPGRGRPASRPGAAAAVLAAHFAAWLPLVAVPALYAELPLIAAGLAGVGVGTGAGSTAGPFAPMHDAAVIRWELALFAPWLGGSPSLVLAGRAPWTALSELLHLAYLAYYAIIYVPPALLWWEAAWRRGSALRGVISGAAAPRAAYDASAFTVLLAFVLCYVAFAVFPVQGPWYTWETGGPNGLPLAGPVRAFVQGLLVAGSSRGTAFPSSHVAVSVAQTVALARVAPRLAWVVGPATVLLVLGAVYGGYHYGVDAVAGAVVGTAAGWVGPRLVQWVAGRG